MALVDPVIILPGITATYLRDEYPLPPEYVWKVLPFTKKFGRVALHPNDLRYEAKEPARLQPGQLYEIAYEELIEEIKYNLKRKEDEPVPVFPFTYDWRMRLIDIQDKLDEFVQEVIDRTKLLKHYHRDGYAKNPKVNLIGHSMGGLIIAGYLKNKGKNAPVNKVVTLATPYQGSFETLVQVTTGNANFGTSPPSSREREAARITPALYHLIPSFTKGIETDPGIPRSLFNPAVWQPSIVQSIREWIRLRGLPTEPPGQLAKKVFAKLLADGKKHRNDINSFKLEDAGLTPDKWLAVVGVDSKTRVHVKIKKKGNNPEFVFNAKNDLKNKWKENKIEQSKEARETGDGTVPFEGAVPKFLNWKTLFV